MLQKSYQEKSITYYGGYREDILPLVPKNVRRALDIGCGNGNTLDYLKKSGHCQYTIGVELFPEAAKEAQSKLDEVYQDNIENPNFFVEEGSIDLILCLDVLEHLVEPQKAVKYLHTLLSPSGVMIASIPNVRHYSVVWPLFFQDKWEYTDSGILDSTHLRFFVRKTAIELVESSGLVHKKVIEKKGGWKCTVMNLLTLGLLRSVYIFQYLILAERNDHTSIDK
jgi:2-polyprenyl-3-methyl-5-hydroxy-6-metoxy-1,4-benzoquinol methylase